MKAAPNRGRFFLPAAKMGGHELTQKVTKKIQATDNTDQHG